MEKTTEKTFTLEEMNAAMNENLRESLEKFGIPIDELKYGDFIPLLMAAVISDTLGEELMNRPLNSFETVGDVMKPLIDVFLGTDLDELLPILKELD